jgi:two-component system sensor histidine kinase QseC
MTSIKKNLITRLSFLVIFALIIIYFFSFINTRKEIREVFDADLIKSAKLLESLIKNDPVKKNGEKFIFDKQFQQKILNRYEYKIHAQAWKNNQVIYNSGESLELVEPDVEGFSNVELNEKKWRGFAFFDQESKIKILVLEELEIRNALIFEIILSLLIPLFISFIPLFLIISFTVKKELRPLEMLGLKIKKISTNSLSEFKNPQAPKELKPFLTSFNSLLIRLSESMESERRFTDYAAHELNTPLAAIKLQAQFLAANKDKEKEREYLQDLIEGVNRATHLVNDLLTLARLESDSKNLSKEKFDLVQLIKFVAAEFKNKADEKKIRLNFIFDERSSELVMAYKSYVEILLRNLIDNAIKYGEENSDVEILLTKKSKKFHLKISNKGEEILSEEIAKLFRNFYRINSIKSSNIGSGLGLAICKKITDLHFGEISFGSKNGINSVEVSL